MPQFAAHSRILALFAKWPRPGDAKTRLGDLGPEVARAFLLDCVGRYARIDARRILAFAPPDAEESFADLVQGRFRLIPQRPGDLGQPLSGGLKEHLETASNSYVFVP